HPLGNAVDLHQVLDRGTAHGLGRAEMVQEGALPRRADSRDLVERVPDQLPGAARAVRADGEAVGLVAQALDEVEDRIAHRQAERLAAADEETLAPGVAVDAL